MITEALLGEIKVAKFFSVLADEATDCANVEQMAVVLRFVDNEVKIREEFLGFTSRQNGLSGEVLSKEIMYKAGGTKEKIKTFDFIVCLVLAEHCLNAGKLDTGTARESIPSLFAN